MGNAVAVGGDPDIARGCGENVANSGSLHVLGGAEQALQTVPAAIRVAIDNTGAHRAEPERAAAALGHGPDDRAHRRAQRWIGDFRSDESRGAVVTHQQTVGIAEPQVAGVVLENAVILSVEPAVRADVSDATAGKVEVSQALPSGQPGTAVVVGCHGADLSCSGARLVHRPGRKMPVVGMKTGQPTIVRADEEIAVSQGQQTADVAVRQGAVAAAAGLEYPHVDAVEARQPTLGADPYQAMAVLHERGRHRVWQAVGCGDDVEGGGSKSLPWLAFGMCWRQAEQCQRQDQQGGKNMPCVVSGAADHGQDRKTATYQTVW